MNYFCVMLKLLGLVLLATPVEAYSCASTATYQSVVLNDAPKTIPVNALLFKVRVSDGYFVSSRDEIQGLRAVILEPVGLLERGTVIEIKARVGSMCDTWNDIWSRDSDITDGVLSGYIVGKKVGLIGDRVIVWPRLYRRLSDREEGRPGNSYWMHERYRGWNLERFKARPDGIWKPLRFDESAIANNLDETNRLIREGTERLKNERP